MVSGNPFNVIFAGPTDAGLQQNQIAVDTPQPIANATIGRAVPAVLAGEVGEMLQPPCERGHEPTIILHDRLCPALATFPVCTVRSRRRRPMIWPSASNTTAPHPGSGTATVVSVTSLPV